MKKLLKCFVYATLAICIIGFLATQIRFAFFANNISEFDGAINLLPHYYVKHGLIPYKDFEYPYTPGLFLLIGKLIPFTSILERNLLMTAYNLIFVTLSCLLLSKLIKRKYTQLLCISLFLFLLAETNVWSTFQIQSLFILLSIYLLTKKTTPRLFLKSAPGILVFILFFIRWDVAVLYALFPLSILFVGFLTRGVKNYALVAATLSSLAGLLTGILLLSSYLVFNNALAEGIENIFTLPVVTIMSYRRLPLPALGSPFKLDFLIYVTLIAAITNLIITLFEYLKKTNKNKEQLSQFYICLIPFIMLPYALGRADWLHAVPFHMLTALSLLLSAAIWSQYKKMALFFLLFIPFMQLLPIFHETKPANTKVFHADVNKEIAPCKELAQKQTYNSLYVGRVSYGQYVIGTSALYLVNPEIKPATRLSILDPGVQNSCEYGAIVANDLARAPRPMLVFLDTTVQEIEPNATRYMKSCGKIETTLGSLAHKDIGTCKAYGKTFLLRMYK